MLFDNDDFDVPARTDAELETIGERLGALLDSPIHTLTANEFLSQLATRISGGIKLEERPDEFMRRREAFAIPDRGIIYGCPGFVRGVQEDDSSSRFVLAHEVSHIVLHKGEAPMARMFEGNIKHPAIPEDRSAEHQASKAARAMLMPSTFALSAKNAFELANRARVPEVHAELRLKYLSTLSCNKTVPSEAISFLSTNKPAVMRAGSVEHRLAGVERDKRVAWEACETIPDEAPDLVRLAGGFRVEWTQYLKHRHQCGWCINRGRVRAYIDLSSA